MKRKLRLTAIFACITSLAFSQATNIYQPNGTTTNFGKVAADSLNYYVVNYPALTLMKIDGSNNATLMTTLSADPIQTMICNNGKGIFPVANGAPFKLFDGTNLVDVNGGQLPMAGYTADKVILGDYFHKGNTTYFRTQDKIYKTDYSSPASIQTIATKQDPSLFGGIFEMQHTSNSIFYWDVVSSSSFPSQLKRIDLGTGVITTVDSSNTGSSDYGVTYNDAYYFCTPYGPSSLGNSKVYKISDAGVKTVVYTETASNKNLLRLIGVTPNAVIAIMATTSLGMEYVAINSSGVISLNFNTVANSLPCGNVGVGSSRTTQSLVYFEALDTNYTVNSNNKALWVTDGTLAGTKKIVGGTPTNFGIDNLSTSLRGSAENCGDDLFFAGKNGANSTRLISVSAGSYAVQTSTFGLFATQPSIRKTASGIEAIGSPFPTSSVEKAVFKANCTSPSSIKEQNSNQLQFEIVPNPSQGEFSVRLENKSNSANLTIYNMVGENVYAERLMKSSNQLNLNLKAGIYFLNIELNGIRTTRKLLIE